MLPDKVEYTHYLYLDGKKESAQGLILDYVLDETIVLDSLNPDALVVDIPEDVTVHDTR